MPQAHARRRRCLNRCAKIRLMTPIFPIVLLLAGAAALVVLHFVPRFQSTALVATSLTGLAWLTLLGQSTLLPMVATVSAWPEALPARTALVLEVDWLAWVLGLVALTLTLGTLLTSFARPGGRRAGVRGAMLMLAATVLIALFSRNLITRVVAWVGFDIVYFLALILPARDRGLQPQAVLHLAFNSAGTLLALAAAVLINQQTGFPSLRETALTSETSLLITLAAVFRLGLFPLHLGLPAEANIRQGLGTLLRIFPALVALEMMARVTGMGMTPDVQGWLSVLALAALGVGGVQLWTTEDPRFGLTYMVVAQSGVALLAGLWGGAQAATSLVAQAVALALGGGLIYLSQGHADTRRAWTAFPILGALMMLGLPLSVGWLSATGLYAGLLAAGQWLVWLVLVAGQTIFAAGVWRVVFWPGEPVEGLPATRLAYALGLGMLGLVGLGLGLSVSLWGATAAPTPDIWLGWSTWVTLVCLGLVWGGGWAGWRFEHLTRAYVDKPAQNVLAILRLDWLYEAVWRVIRLFTQTMLGLAQVLEGEGALLWAIIVVLVVWLALN